MSQTPENIPPQESRADYIIKHLGNSDFKSTGTLQTLNDIKIIFDKLKDPKIFEDEQNSLTNDFDKEVEKLKTENNLTQEETDELVEKFLKK